MYYDLPLAVEPTTSLDEVLNFIDYYWHKSPIEFTKFCFNDGVTFKWQRSIEFFKSLLHLHLESAINFDIKWECENEMWNKNKKINDFLNTHIKEESWFLARLINWESYKYYDIFSIENDFKYFNDNIRDFDYLRHSITINWYSLLTLLFCKIHKELWYKNIDSKTISKNLFNNIKEQTWWKNSHLGKINIFYHFHNDYMQENRIILPIISELEHKGKVKISNIKLEDEYIYFELDRINDISEKLFIDISEKIVGWKIKPKEINISYIEDSFLINNHEIEFKSKNTKIFHIYNLLFDTINYFKKNHVSFEQLEEMLLKNPEKYSKITTKHLANYDSSLRKSIQEKNKIIYKEHKIETFVGINATWIWCENYMPEKQ